MRNWVLGHKKWLFLYKTQRVTHQKWHLMVTLARSSHCSIPNSSHQCALGGHLVPPSWTGLPMQGTSSVKPS